MTRGRGRFAAEDMEEGAKDIGRAFDEMMG